MIRFRISARAQRDLDLIVEQSGERWGDVARERYTTLLVEALREIMRAPTGPGTRDRANLVRGVRSLHLRDAREARAASRVNAPVHVIFYRVGIDRIDVVRVLHERMEASRHLPSK